VPITLDCTIVDGREFANTLGTIYDGTKRDEHSYHHNVKNVTDG